MGLRQRDKKDNERTEKQEQKSIIRHNVQTASLTAPPVSPERNDGTSSARTEATRRGHLLESVSQQSVRDEISVPSHRLSVVPSTNFYNTDTSTPYTYR